MPVKSPEAVHLRLPSSSPLASVDAEMKVLREMWDKDVDYSGIAPLAAGLFRPVSELIPTENKQQITLRLDADVIDFFRATGRRYQSRMNAALREDGNGQKRAI